MSELSDLLKSQPVSARQAADLAEEQGIRLPYGTIAAYWAGKHGRPSRQTLERLAAVLPIPLGQLQRAAWNATAPLGRYTPPPEADLLGDRQRRALDELIKAMVEGVSSSAEPEGEKQESRTEEGSSKQRSTGGGTGSPGAPIGGEDATSLTWKGRPAEELTDEELQEAAAVDEVWAAYVRTRHFVDHNGDWDF